MAGVEVADGGRVRVMGALDASVLHLLTKAISDGNVVLDLTAVSAADENAVNLLARLPAGQCGFVGCPRWLAQRVERRLIELASGIW
jgi:hypothetical protein